MFISINILNVLTLLYGCLLMFVSSSLPSVLHLHAFLDIAHHLGIEFMGKLSILFFKKNCCCKCSNGQSSVVLYSLWKNFRYCAGIETLAWLILTTYHTAAFKIVLYRSLNSKWKFCEKLTIIQLLAETGESLLNLSLSVFSSNCPSLIRFLIYGDIDRGQI